MLDTQHALDGMAGLHLDEAEGLNLNQSQAYVLTNHKPAAAIQMTPPPNTHTLPELVSAVFVCCLDPTVLLKKLMLK